MSESRNRELEAYYLLWAAAFLLWEAAVQQAVVGAFRFWPDAGFCLAAAALGTAACGLPGRVGGKVGAVLFPLAYAFYGTQLVYADIFGSYLSLAYTAMGGEAVTAFWSIAAAAIGRCLPRLLVMALPLIAFYVLRRKKWLPIAGRPLRSQLALVGVGAAVPVLLVLTLPLMGTGAGSPHSAFYGASATIDRRAEQLGLLTAGVLDAKQTLLGSGGVRVSGGLDLTAGGRGPTNVLDGMDFDRLDEATEDGDLLSLNNYFASLQGTVKNSYTGMFADYNLIVICAEAFSPYLIDPELTPTLYRMSNEGIVFRNFYNSFPNLTTNGEYGLCMGLMPDLSRMSFAVSKDNYLPFCLGNMFSQAGVEARAYHNNIGTFYDRVNTHTNMGYTFEAIDFGLDMEPGNPTSDLEMMEKTVDEYLDQEPFHAYYMTYSGHADYSFTDNDMSAQNQDLVADMEGSEELRAYYACQLELEKAMEYLLERLEEAGVADHTVVVLTGDHAPYGLPEEDYETLAGDAVEEPFWQYRNSFICWTGGLEEPIVVEDYCCTQDILPTLLNLFGFDYDSRLLTGRDVLADCTHAALLKDGSFLTADMVYDASSGEITWLGEEDEAYAQELIQAMENQLTVSAAILDTNYYDFAFRTLGLSAGRTQREHYASYADIEGTWYEDAVESLTSLGALSGGGTGDFVGESPASRAAVLAMLTRGLGLEAGEEELPYTDLEEGLWYVDTVSAAWSAGLLPEGETQFRPDDPITAEEAEALFAAAAQYRGAEDSGTLAEQVVSQAMERQAEEGPDLGEDILSRGAAAYAAAALLEDLASLPS